MTILHLYSNNSALKIQTSLRHERTETDGLARTFVLPINVLLHAVDHSDTHASVRRGRTSSLICRSLISTSTNNQTTGTKIAKIILPSFSDITSPNRYPTATFQILSPHPSRHCVCSETMAMTRLETFWKTRCFFRPVPVPRHSWSVCFPAQSAAS